VKALFYIKLVVLDGPCCSFVEVYSLEAVCCPSPSVISCQFLITIPRSYSTYRLNRMQSEARHQAGACIHGSVVTLEVFMAHTGLERGWGRGEFQLQHCAESHWFVLELKLGMWFLRITLRDASGSSEPDRCSTSVEEPNRMTIACCIRNCYNAG
jgi:hypothetical protein